MFLTTKDILADLKKHLILKTKKSINEEYIYKPGFENQTDTVIEFKGFVGNSIPNYFEGFEGKSQLICNELEKIVNPKLFPKCILEEPFIGVHIRMGDFIELKDLNELRTADALNYRLPLSWYIESIMQLRRQIGTNIAIKVFSDASTEELTSILSLGNVQLIRGNSAITDILLLSRSFVIIASGSTFSMWAAFLGQVPSVWFTGFRRGNLILGDKEYEFQPEWENGPFKQSFISVLQQNLKAKI
jgi:hypothetical protein